MGARLLPLPAGQRAEQLLTALALTNRYRKRLPHRLWRRLHYLNFAVWLLALVHGVTAGTDTFAPWALALYAGSVWLIVALFVNRLTRETPKEQRPVTVAGEAGRQHA